MSRITIQPEYRICSECGCPGHATQECTSKKSKECQVCCNNYTKFKNKKISCPFCNYDCCSSCFQTYLTSSTHNTECMNCRKELTLDFISTNTSKTFHNKTYRDKRANDLLSKEKSLLPNTQGLFESIKEEKKILEEVKELETAMKLMKLQIREKMIRVEGIKYDRNHQTTGQATEKKQFVKKCIDENCRGFLSHAWKCGTCDINACSKCHRVKNEEHTCNPDDVATVDLLKSDTKPCPSCSIPIYKIDGCDLMWCVTCHTTFSWKSGQVTTVSHNHNPHYYQWLRENKGSVPRTPGDNPCEAELIQITTLSAKLNADKIDINSAYPSELRIIHRYIGDMVYANLPLYQARDTIEDNTDLRLKYLGKEINEEYWFKTLKMRQKRYEKNREINQVLNMFLNVGYDLFRGYVNNDIRHNQAIESFHEIKKYANVELEKIGEKYDNTVPIIQWKTPKDARWISY